MSSMDATSSSNLSIFKSMKFQRRFGIVIRWIIAVILIIFSIFPVLWIISASFNPSSSLATQHLIPENASFENYQQLFKMENFPFTTWLWNSVKVTTISTLLSVFITTVAAYAFSRFRFTGRQTLMKIMLLLQVFPSLLSIVAIFALITQVGDVIPGLGLDTHAGLIMVYLGGAMSINIWLMKGFFDTIPRDIDESAMVDGATHWQIFTKLLLPLLRPILIVVGILTLIGTFGDFILARILLKSTDQFTLMVGLQIYTSGMFSQKWGIFAAGALIGALPIMAVYMALQDYIVGGLTQGAVKG
jgi:arabinogalactan oligomer/maltooligosaccharide transport system permease protein